MEGDDAYLKNGTGFTNCLSVYAAILTYCEHPDACAEVVWPGSLCVT